MSPLPAAPTAGFDTDYTVYVTESAPMRSATAAEITLLETVTGAITTGAHPAVHIGGWWRTTPATDGRLAFDFALNSTTPSGHSWASVGGCLFVLALGGTTMEDLTSITGWSPSAGTMATPWVDGVAVTGALTYYLAGVANDADATSQGLISAPTSVDWGPEILLNPVSITVQEGHLATFHSAAGGHPTPTCQWQRRRPA
jgi:hypothetical protein